MEAVEFYIINGQTCLRRNGVGKALTPSDREEVTFMLDNMQRYFPEAVKRLREWASGSVANKYYFEYRIVDRFIRCNFGDADFLYSDIEDDMFHFEEVKCPLRGICKDEGDARGYLPKEIAAHLGKAEKTCKEQIRSACKRLHLPHPRWLIKLFSFYSI